jgi:hypothetical protein
MTTRDWARVALLIVLFVLIGLAGQADVDAMR